MNRILAYIFLLAGAIFCFGQTSVITGTVKSPNGQPYQTQVSFLSKSTPVGISGNLVPTKITATTATNGTFSQALFAGNYQVTIKGAPGANGWADSVFTIGVPTNAATYDITELMTNVIGAIVYISTNQAYSIYPSNNITIATNGTSLYISSTATGSGSGSVTNIAMRSGTGILMAGDTNITTSGTNTISVDTSVIPTRSDIASSNFVDSTQLANGTNSVKNYADATFPTFAQLANGTNSVMYWVIDQGYGTGGSGMVYNGTNTWTGTNSFTQPIFANGTAGINIGTYKLYDDAKWIYTDALGFYLQGEIDADAYYFNNLNIPDNNKVFIIANGYMVPTNELRYGLTFAGTNTHSGPASFTSTLTLNGGTNLFDWANMPTNAISGSGGDVYLARTNVFTGTSNIFSGNVGIGMVPTFKLDVYGTIRAQDSLVSNGGSVQAADSGYFAHAGRSKMYSPAESTMVWMNYGDTYTYMANTNGTLYVPTNVVVGSGTNLGDWAKVQTNVLSSLGGYSTTNFNNLQITNVLAAPDGYMDFRGVFNPETAGLSDIGQFVKPWGNVYASNYLGFGQATFGTITIGTSGTNLNEWATTPVGSKVSTNSGTAWDLTLRGSPVFVGTPQTPSATDKVLFSVDPDQNLIVSDVTYSQISAAISGGSTNFDTLTVSNSIRIHTNAVLGRYTSTNDSVAETGTYAWAMWNGNTNTGYDQFDIGVLLPNAANPEAAELRYLVLQPGAGIQVRSPSAFYSSPTLVAPLIFNHPTNTLVSTGKLLYVNSDGYLTNSTIDYNASVGGGSAVSEIYKLTYESGTGNVAVNAGLATNNTGIDFELYLTNSATVLYAPTNATKNGQVLKFRVIQDSTGGRIVSTNGTASASWRFGQDIYRFNITTNAGSVSYISAEWYPTNSTWNVIGSLGGY